MIDSSICVLAFLLIFIFLNVQYRHTVENLILTRYFSNLFVLFTVTICWMLLVIMANLTWDFSFVVTFVHIFIQTVTGFLLFAYFKTKKCEEKIVNYLVLSFLIQTVIQWAGFISPTVNTLVQSTKSQYTLERALQYGGVRNLSLSGNDFFGISSAYALIFLLYWSEMNTIFHKSPALKGALYLFLISGTFFSGRSGYIGLIAAVGYLLSCMLNRRRKRINLSQLVKNTISMAGICSGVAALVVYFYNSFNSNERYYHLFRFTFRPIFEKLENNTFMIGSVDHLLTDMYFWIPPLTFMIGDGLYTGNDGRSYMHTDSGYMRMILLMGIVGFLLMLGIQVFMIGLQRGREKKLKLFVLVLLLILNIKGEVISCELVVLSTGLLFYLQDMFGGTEQEKVGELGNNG